MTELLRYETTESGAIAANSGIILIALILPHEDAYHWRFVGVTITAPTKWLGQHNTIAGAKKEIERRWAKWIEYAGLAWKPAALDPYGLDRAT